MKRTLASIAMLGVAAALLTGCSSSPAQSSNAHVTLTMWHGYTADDGKKLDQIIGDFNRSQSHITIKYSVKTWQNIEQAFLPALSAHDAPQIVALPAEDLPQYAAKGAFADLSSYYTSSAAAKTIKSAAIPMEKINGKAYGVPTGFVPLSVIYNKTMFTKAGITTFPTNWTEWLADAKKLTITPAGSSTPTQYGLLLPDHATVGNGVWASLFYGNGGTIESNGKATLDSAANVQTLKFWSDAVRDDKISPTGINGIQSDGLFSSGKAAMEIGGPWMSAVAAGANIDSGVAAIPAGPKSRAASAIGVSMGVTSQVSAAQKAAAETFFNYFYSKKVAAEWSLGSGWPPLVTTVANSAVSSNPTVAALTRIAGTARPLLPGVVNSTDVLSAVDDATQHALSGTDPSSALKAAQPAAQTALRSK